MGKLVGRQIGPYTITEEIGRGGMAVVYKAHQTSIGRDVAVKVLPAHFLQDPTFLERFSREAKAVARLQNPRILPVYDAGEHEGLPYIVMAYLPGGTLAERMRGGLLPLEEVVRLTEQIAEGLDYAHRRGIIHRDVKPSNVMLDEEGNAYLADFGIAKVAETTAQLTGSGIVGTPAYMAPEMADPGPPTPLVDVYALGVVVFQMLTGRLPFEADTPMGLIAAHISKPLPDVRVLRPELPAAVQGVLERAMAKAPGERYQTAGELARELQRALRGEAAPAPPREEATLPLAEEGATRYQPTMEPASWPQYTAPAPADEVRPRRKRGWVWATVLLVLAAVGVGLWAWNAQQQELARQAALATAAARGYATATAQAQVTPTPHPRPAAVIAPENAEQVVQLARWGKGSVGKIAYSPDGRLLAVASSLGIYLYDAGTLAEVRFIETDAWVLSVAFSPDGQTLASGSDDGTVRLWRAADGTLLRTLEGHTDGVLSVAFSPDGATLASGSYDNTVRLWRAADGTLLRTLEGHTDGVLSVAFSPDGQTLASGSLDGTVRLWRVSDGAPLRTLEGHTYVVESVAFSPDGATLASGSYDNTVRLWRVADGSLLHTLEGHTGWVESVAFSPDGATLASGSRDNTVRLWRVADGRLLRTLEGHTGWVESVAFSPDGATLASGSWDGTVRLWGVAP